MCGKGVGLSLFLSDSLESQSYDFDEIAHVKPIFYGILIFSLNGQERKNDAIALVVKNFFRLLKLEKLVNWKILLERIGNKIVETRKNKIS